MTIPTPGMTTTTTSTTPAPARMRADDRNYKHDFPHPHAEWMVTISPYRTWWNGWNPEWVIGMVRNTQKHVYR